MLDVTQLTGFGGGGRLDYEEENLGVWLYALAVNLYIYDSSIPVYRLIYNSATHYQSNSVPPPLTDSAGRYYVEKFGYRYTAGVTAQTTSPDRYKVAATYAGVEPTTVGD